MSREGELSLGFKQEGPLTEEDFSLLAVSLSGVADEFDQHIQWLQRFAEKRGIKKGDYIRHALGRITTNTQTEGDTNV